MSELIPEQLDTECALQAELNRIVKILALPQMKVIWAPDNSKTVAGQVIGKTVVIFDREMEEATITLRHEAIDYLVCRAVEPYKQLLNALIKLLNEKAYIEKESVVDSLTKLFEADKIS